jgi:hypothetical protein
VSGLERGAPILVTGTHRSGTTWTGRMLALSGEALEVHEPFNPCIYKTWFRHRPPVWFQHVDASNAPAWEAEVTRVVDLRPAVAAIALRGRTPRALARAGQIALSARRARREGRRPLLKDPIAFFAAEWLAERFGTRNVVLVRHPAAFASSLKRLDWRFDFRNLTAQETLLSGDLADFADEIRAAARAGGDLDVIDQAVLLWRIFTARTLAYRQVHPDWIVLRYEDLASDPLPAFAELYGKLGLTWSPRVAGRMEAATGAGNASEVAAGDRGGVERNSTEAMWTWLRRLTPGEIARVRAGTVDLAPPFYSGVDWDRPA